MPDVFDRVEVTEEKKDVFDRVEIKEDVFDRVETRDVFDRVELPASDKFLQPEAIPFEGVAPYPGVDLSKIDPIGTPEVLARQIFDLGAEEVPPEPETVGQDPSALIEVPLEESNPARDYQKALMDKHTEQSSVFEVLQDSVLGGLLNVVGAYGRGSTRLTEFVFRQIDRGTDLVKGQRLGTTSEDRRWRVLFAKIDDPEGFDGLGNWLSDASSRLQPFLSHESGFASPIDIAKSLASATGQAGGYMIPGLIAGPVAGPSVAFGTGAVVGADEVFTRAIESGLPEDSAFGLSLIGGTLYGMVEMAQRAGIFRPGASVREALLRSSGSRLQRILKTTGRVSIEQIKTALWEGVEEVTQEGVVVLFGELPAGKLNLERFLKNAPRAFGGGALAGFGLGAAGAVTQVGAEAVAPRTEAKPIVEKKIELKPKAESKVEKKAPPEKLTPERIVEEKAKRVKAIKDVLDLPEEAEVTSEQQKTLRTAQKKDLVGLLSKANKMRFSARQPLDIRSDPAAAILDRWAVLHEDLSGETPEAIDFRRRRLTSKSEELKIEGTVVIEKNPAKAYEAKLLRGGRIVTKSDRDEITKSVEFMDEFSKKLNFEIIWFNDPKHKFAGFSPILDQGFYAINIDKTDPTVGATERSLVFPQVVMHELNHSITYTDPVMKKALRAVIDKYAPKLLEEKRQDVLKQYPKYITESKELTADEAYSRVFEQMFFSDKFWERVEQSDPEFYGKFRTFFGKIIKRIKNAIKTSVQKVFGKDSDRLGHLEKELGTLFASFDTEQRLKKEFTGEFLEGLRSKTKIELERGIEPLPGPVPSLAEEAKPSEEPEPLPSPKFYKASTGRTKSQDWIAKHVDVGAPLKTRPAGIRFLELAKNADTTKRQITGPLDTELFSLRKKTPKKIYKWLSEVDEEGFTNLRKMLEHGLEPPGEVEKEWRELGLKINTVLGLRAEQLRIYRRGKGGTLELFKRANTGRLMRAFTRDFVNAIVHRNGPEYDSVVEAITKANPDMKSFELKRAMRKAHEGLKRSEARMLEHTRVIKNLPDVIEHQGKPLALLHTDPFTVLSRALSIQANRIAVVEHFGQHKVKSVSLGQMKSISKALKVLPTFNKATLMISLMEKGLSREDVLGKTYKELSSMAKKLGVPRGVTQTQVMDSILNLESLEGLSDSELNAAMKVFKRIGGIDLTLTGDELLADVKLRVGEVIEDLMSELRENFRKEGGDADAFDVVAGLVQGLPYQFTKRTSLSRGWRFFSSLVGAGNTTLTAIPNITQPLALVLPLSGPKRFSEALFNVIAHWGRTQSRGLRIGAYKHLGVPRSNEPGYFIEYLSDLIRRKVSRATTLQFNLHKNNVIAGEAGRLLAGDWKKGGIPASELGVARFLELTSKEISAVQSGKMSEKTFAKIVHSMVDKTQFVTSPRFQQGVLTLSPIAREFFPYQSYTTGTLRSTLALADDLAKNIKEKNAKKSLLSAKRLMAVIASMAGLGVLNQLIQDTLRGRPREEEEEKKRSQRLLEGLLSIGFLGPTQRIMWTLTKEFSLEKMALSFSPKITAAMQALVIPYNAGVHALHGAGVFKNLRHTVGDYGKLPVSDQASKWALKNISILRATVQQYHNIAYPEMKEYFEVRRLARKYRTKRAAELGKDIARADRASIPSVYDPIIELLIRGELVEAVRKTESIRKSDRTGEFDQKLRQALRNARPDKVPTKEFFLFLASLPPDKAKAVLAKKLDWDLKVGLIAPAKRR